MKLTKDGKIVETCFRRVYAELKSNGWEDVPKNETVTISDRVDALEDAVTEIAEEVYKDG